MLPKIRLLALALVGGRIDMELASRRVGLRLGARLDPDRVRGFTGNAIGIREPELALIFGAGLWIKNVLTGH